MEPFTSKNKTKKATVISIVVFVLVFAAFIYLVGNTKSRSADSTKETIEKTVEHCISQCYAIEGRYPMSLQYMEDNYGLIYDKSTYFIDYRAEGSNLRPTAIVLRKGGNSE